MRCVAKVAYFNHSGAAGAASNRGKVAYIARAAAAEPDASGARLWTSGPAGRRSLTARAACAALGGGPVFRLILSPGAPGVDLRALADGFMRSSFLPAVGCRGAVWVAAAHVNTANPHVHILVSRRRPGGRGPLLRFGSAYVRSGRMAREAGLAAEAARTRPAPAPAPVRAGAPEPARRREGPDVQRRAPEGRSPR